MDFIEDNIVLCSFIAGYILMMVIFIVFILFFPKEIIQEFNEDWK
jgi:ABC-type branched-subunit amino acid transport system permease subunit